jgi:hypothetical protein
MSGNDVQITRVNVQHPSELMERLEITENEEEKI